MGDSDMTDKTAPTPLPWEVSKSFQLQILKSCCDWAFSEESQPDSALTVGIYSVTMSPVLNVVLFDAAESGPRFHFQAVLKLYDRRFGTGLRRHRYQHVPHTAEREADFQEFVRQGKMGDFLERQEGEEEKEEEEEEKEEGQDKDDDKPESPLDTQAQPFPNEPPNSEPTAEFEAAVWKECQDNFTRETEAYERLQDLQGKSIPRIYAHVRLVLPFQDTPQDLLASPDTARFFEVKGIILERIPGYPLSDLPTSPLAPSDTEQWPGIVQAAVDAVHEIDTRGVLIRNCAPRNVVVNCRSQTPFVVDLASCWFKDKMIREWRERGWMDEGDDPDIEYWEEVVTTNNEGAIGAAMTARLRQMKGLEWEIKYPDSEKILEEMKRARGVRSTRDKADTSGWRIMYA